MSGHPSGVGLWGMKRRGVVEGYIRVARGHTAREAFDASGLRQEGYGFNELTFELVQDEAPPLPVEPAPVSPAIVRKVRRPRGRMVGAERGARP